MIRLMKEEHEEYQVQKMLLGEGDAQVRYIKSEVEGNQLL